MINQLSEQAIMAAQHQGQPWPLWAQVAIGVAVGMVAWSLVVIALATANRSKDE